MSIRKIAFSITLFFNLFSVNHATHGACNEKRKPLLLVKPKTKKMKTQDNQAPLLQPDKGLLAAETKAVKSNDKKEEKVELELSKDKSATTNPTDIDNKFFETKDAIFKLFPSDEVIQKDLKIITEHFNALHPDSDDKIDFIIFHNKSFGHLSTYRFINSITAYLCKELNIQPCNIALRMRHPFYFFTSTKRQNNLDEYLNRYYLASAMRNSNIIAIGKGFIEMYLLKNNLSSNKEIGRKIFIFTLAHEIVHLTEENSKKPCQKEREIHADKLAALLCSTLFSNFNPSEIFPKQKEFQHKSFKDCLKNTLSHLDELYSKRTTQANCLKKLTHKIFLIMAKTVAKFSFKSLSSDNNAILETDLETHPSWNERIVYMIEALRQEHV